MSAAFFAEIRDTVVPDRTGRHGPLPPLLISMTLVTGLVDAFSYLVLGHVFVANMTGNVVLLGFALAGTPGFSITASLAAVAAFAAGALIGGKLGARHRGHRARLHSSAGAAQAVFLAADSKLAGGPGSKAGRRLVPVVAMLAGALLGAALIRHAQAYDALAIALAVIGLGAAVSYLTGRSDPAWVHPPSAK